MLSSISDRYPRIASSYLAGPDNNVSVNRRNVAEDLQKILGLLFVSFHLHSQVAISTMSLTMWSRDGAIATSENDQKLCKLFIEISKLYSQMS